MSLTHRFLATPAVAALAIGSFATTSANAQQIRAFEMNPSTFQQVHWSATSNLGPMGAFLQSYTFGGDVVVSFDNTPSLGMARVTSARLRVPNSVVGAVMQAPGGTVFWRDLVLDATTPDFVILPTFPAPTFATTLDLFVSSGVVEIHPPFGPSISMPIDGTSLGSIPITGSFPMPGPTQGLRLDGFSFDMDFSAPGFNGTFTHDVVSIEGTTACPTPIPYCPQDPTNPFGGTQLHVVGSTSVAANNFTLQVTGAPATPVGIFFYGPRATEVFSGIGTVCVGGPLTRLGAAAIDPSGNAQMTLDLAQYQTGPAALEPGSHHSFQFWHRAMSPAGGPSWDFSNAIAATFCP